MLPAASTRSTDRPPAPMSSSPTHVLHVSPALFGERGLWGGGERYAVELARAQSRIVPTRLLTMGSKADRWTDDVLDVQVLQERFRYKGHELNSLSEQLIRHIAGSRFVHIHQYNTMLTSVCLLLASALRRPAFVTDHGGSSPNLNRRLSAHRLVRRYLAVSEYARNYLPELADRTTVVYGGVDVSRFRLRADPPRREHSVVCVARIMPQKGIDVLIRAVDALTSVTIYGRPYDETYKAHLERLAEGKRIEFVHNASDAEVVAAMQTAKVLVLPSVYRTYDGHSSPNAEYLGLALIEAMACGTPVIGTRVGGIPELIDNARNGLLVEPGDPDQLRAAIDDVLGAGADQWQQLSRACVRMVEEKFTWRGIAQRCLEEYEAHST
jgi:glycosyltransferase involved in cell wall biosynthesis